SQSIPSLTARTTAPALRPGILPRRLCESTYRGSWRRCRVGVGGVSVSACLGGGWSQWRRYVGGGRSAGLGRVDRAGVQRPGHVGGLLGDDPPEGRRVGLVRDDLLEAFDGVAVHRPGREE